MTWRQGGSDSSPTPLTSPAFLGAVNGVPGGKAIRGRIKVVEGNSVTVERLVE